MPSALLPAFALSPVKQAYLLQVRQMQALSFSAHPCWSASSP